MFTVFSLKIVGLIFGRLSSKTISGIPCDGKKSTKFPLKVIPGLIGFLLMIVLCDCARVQRRPMEVTAYCGCGECCGWERGSNSFLNLNFWNRYISKGPHRGEKYSGRTASGTRPRQYYPGLFSLNTLTHPWWLPFRIVFPWKWLPHRGSLAADTRYYPFGTKMLVPGYGPGIVEDRGSVITGPDRLDVFYRSHQRALKWGRRKVVVEIKTADP